MFNQHWFCFPKHYLSDILEFMLCVLCAVVFIYLFFVFVIYYTLEYYVCMNICGFTYICIWVVKVLYNVFIHSYYLPTFTKAIYFVVLEHTKETLLGTFYFQPLHILMKYLKLNTTHYIVPHRQFYTKGISV